MSVNYASHFNTKKTHQSQPIPGRTDQVKNNAGGYVFAISKWDQMLRFLILGSEGGTYYASERKLTVDNAKNTIECIKEDPTKAVNLIKEVSLKGRAAKQDSTIFALALACTFAPEDKRTYAYAAIKDVCRTGTHLFTFTNYIQNLRGWSRGLRNAVSKFYTEKPLDKLELQVVKYRNRAGFSHRDVMRLAHPKTSDTKRNGLFKYAVGKMEPSTADITEYKGFRESFSLVDAYESAKILDPKSAKDTRKMAQLIADTKLPREGVPTGFLNKTEVWEALLEDMPMTAMVRNLGKLASLDMTKSNLSSATVKIISTLGDQDKLKYSRIHPMQLLVASKIYSRGYGDRGGLSWNPNSKIVGALDKAFYDSFGNVESTGLNYMLALDVSGSMTSSIMGSPLSCREASAAMAMITARTEENYDVIGFTSSNGWGGNANRLKRQWNGPSKLRGHGGVSHLDVDPSMRLDSIVKNISGLPFGSTDCALPMVYATENKIPVDVFVIYTDNETWQGNIHASQALKEYRQKMGRNAKCIVVGMTANGFSIADPKDPGMLDVVGFDTATPQLISNFSRGLEL